MPRNSHLACRFGGAAAGCGYMAPPEDPASVHALYDEGEGVLRVFIAQQWIPGQTPDAHRFHNVTANAENAWLHRQTVNISGGRDYQSLSAQGAGTLGLFKHGHVAAATISSWTARITATTSARSTTCRSA
ncbi:hypothetical protein G6F32_015767 [Rhizopus arrhizus]|nr:hypothetical protein G6F32_015767 [Rhizopus arrhizus]